MSTGRVQGVVRFDFFHCAGRLLFGNIAGSGGIIPQMISLASDHARSHMLIFTGITLYLRTLGITAYKKYCVILDRCEKPMGYDHPVLFPLFSVGRVASRLGAYFVLYPTPISYVEHGARNPALDTQLGIANALDVDLSTLIKRASERRNRRCSSARV